MSLHDDVADLVTDMWCEDPPDEKDMADKLINKVLDAAMQAIIDCEGRESKFNHIEAIGKLRDES